MRIGTSGGLVAMLSVAALTIAAIDVRPTAAADARLAAKPAGVEQASGDEVSARKRKRYVRHYRDNAAGVRTFGAIAGTIGGIIAADQARRAYRRYYDPYYGYYPYSAYPYGYYGGYRGYTYFDSDW